MSRHESATRTLVVVPAYNEEDALPTALADLAHHCPDLDVVVVDDGSDDCTGALAGDAGAVCLKLDRNSGIGSALKRGFLYAQAHGYDRTVQFDADGQHRADQLPKLLSALDAGAHLAIGNRYAAGDYRIGTIRRLAVALLRVEARAVCGVWFHDVTSGFRAISQPLLSVCADHYPRKYLDSPLALVAAQRSGYRVSEVPVRMSQRVGGAPSEAGLGLACHYFRAVLELLFRSDGIFPPFSARGLPAADDNES